MHVESVAFAVAVKFNRILAYTSDPWMYTTQNHCGETRNPDCYLRKLTNCSIALASSTSSLSITGTAQTQTHYKQLSSWNNVSTSQDIYVLVLPDIYEMFNIEFPKQLMSILDKVSPPLTNASNTNTDTNTNTGPLSPGRLIATVSWYRAQYTRYRLQPNDKLHAHITAQIPVVFRGAIKPPSPLICMVLYCCG